MHKRLIKSPDCVNIANKKTTLYYNVVRITIILFILICPFAILISYTEGIDYQHNNTYIAEINDKYRLLTQTEEKKIVFVGGSSLPFGLRSDLIEQELSDYKVINFGLYATLGTKFMMDLSRANINAGDIVILSPELNEQTYSLYFNPSAVLQACDGLSYKYKNLSAKDNLDLLYNYYKYSNEKIGLYKKGEAIDPIGIYRHDSFNAYGDIYIERLNNIMDNGVDSNMNIYIDETLIDGEFLDYINNYSKYVKGKGAEIYFGFSCANELAIKSSKKKRSSFKDELLSKLQCDLLMDIEDCIMDYRYFYDTNFHLNSSGAIYYTGLLIGALKEKLNISHGDKFGGIDVPSPPEVKPEEPIEMPDNQEKIDFGDYNGEANIDYADWFVYKKLGNSYQIIDVKSEYKNMEEVILPTVYNGSSVTSIAENALYGCINLKRVHIGKSFKTIQPAFGGCISLERIYLYEVDGNKISVPPLGLLDGANSEVKIYIPIGSNYLSGYTWMNYATKFEYF